MQGRSVHRGGWLRFAGFPVAPGDSAGGFSVCGASAGTIQPSASAQGYLARALNLSLDAGQRLALAPADLVGGDVNANSRVDLFDLVRIGAAFNGPATDDPQADLNGDGRVDLFDMVMVGRNYGLAGPLPWTIEGAADAGLAGAGAPAPEAAADPKDGPPATWLAPDAALQDSNGLLEADLRILDARALYGVDFRLAWDPARLTPIDASEALAGLQIDPGPIWSEAPSFIARNALEEAPGPEGWPRLRFAASLLHPAVPASGMAVLARLRFEVLDPEASLDGAFRLEFIELSDPEGQSLPARWDGEAIRLAEALHLPWLGRMDR